MLQSFTTFSVKRRTRNDKQSVQNAFRWPIYCSLATFWWIQNLTVTTEEIIISLNANQTPVKKQTLRLNCQDLWSPAVPWEDHKVYQWNRSVFTSYAVIILTLEAAFTTNVPKLERRKEIWRALESMGGNFTMLKFMKLHLCHYHLWPGRLISSHSSFHTKFPNCEFSHVPLPFIFSYCRKPTYCFATPRLAYNMHGTDYTCLCRWRPYRLVPGTVWQTRSWTRSQRPTRKCNLGKQERFALRKYIIDTREGNTAPLSQHYC